jgi:hypothetical protein
MGDEKNIIAQIETYIRQGGGEYADWYIGLADNPIGPSTEAFRFHKVQNRRFTYIETISHQVARFVSDYFLKVRGTDGNLSNIDTSRTCRAIYIYKKAADLILSESAMSA